MNRCFGAEDLAAATSNTLEDVRARELDAELGPKASWKPKTDFIIDLHNTTSNSGIALMMASSRSKERRMEGGGQRERKRERERERETERD